MCLKFSKNIRKTKIRFSFIQNFPKVPKTKESTTKGNIYVIIKNSLWLYLNK